MSILKTSSLNIKFDGRINFLHVKIAKQTSILNFVHDLADKSVIDFVCKIEKILKGSLDSIPSPSVKIQIMGGKVCLRYEGKPLLGIVNKLLKTKSLLTSTSNVLPYYLQNLLEII